MKSGMNGLSAMAAIVVTVFAAPWFTGLTDEWATSLLVHFYGSTYAYLISWFWFLICSGVIFFGSLTILSVVFINAYAALQERFLPA